MANFEENQDAFGDSTGPTGPVVPEMFEKQEAATSPMAMDAPLGDVFDGRSKERRRGKHGYRSRATSFPMSLSSLSAAAASEPKPIDEGMADFGVGDVTHEHGALETHPSAAASGESSPRTDTDHATADMWAGMSRTARKGWQHRLNKTVGKGK